MPSQAHPRWIAPVPNLLTALRLVLAAAFPFVPEGWRPAVVAAAGASDFLDGFVARRFHAQSDVGRLFDGIADKAFVFSAIGTFVASGLVPWWGALLAVARDLVVGGIATWCAARGAWGAFREMRPRLLGKATTAVVFLWFLTVLVRALAPARPFALAAVAAVSVAAALDYGVQFLRRRRAA